MSCVDNWEIPAKHRKEGQAFIRAMHASKPGDLEKYSTWVESEKEKEEEGGKERIREEKGGEGGREKERHMNL